MQQFFLKKYNISKTVLPSLHKVNTRQITRMGQFLEPLTYIKGMKIMEMSPELRPREKALRYGFASLSDLELLMLLISSGYKDHSVDLIAQDVLSASQNLAALFDMRVKDLTAVKGIQQTKALQILGSVELCRRALRKQAYARKMVAPQDIADWFEMEFGTLHQEHVVAVYVNTSLQIITHQVLFIGTLNTSQIHPREIFKQAFLVNAHGIILVHNHPGGCVRPSQDDLECTRQLLEVAELMGIQLIDHLIVTRNDWYSCLSQMQPFGTES